MLTWNFISLTFRFYYVCYVTSFRLQKSAEKQRQLSARAKKKGVEERENFFNKISSFMKKTYLFLLLVLHETPKSKRK